jgi:aspartyl-tRNA(Asn)/glutamyl-tRNA(Gln) amidotransferase subunit B
MTHVSLSDGIKSSGAPLYRGGYRAVMGLEVHAQIASLSKLFSSAPAEVFGQGANTCVSFVDLAFPGMLPVINKECIIQGVRLGLAIKGTVNLTSVFERKHYFYPDNPAGYQISQYKKPLVEGGIIPILCSDGTTKEIQLERIHLEQDAGKTIHDQDPKQSWVDFNRAGIGLMEIVSRPDLNSPDEVVTYVKTLRSLVRSLGVCHGDMEKGQLRVDANISIHKIGEPLGTRVEIKNMNSTRFLHQALCYEIDRQISALESGETLVQETRTFDTATGQTRTMRTKESDVDYFYFSDPDLPKVVLCEDFLTAIREQIPETPWAKQARLCQDLGLSPYDASLLVDEVTACVFFEEALASASRHPLGQSTARTELAKLTVNWMTGDLFAALNRLGLGLDQCGMKAEDLGVFVALVAAKKLSGPLGKEVFALMLDTGQGPEAVMADRGLEQISDPEEIRSLVRATLSAHEGHVAEYLSGKDKLKGFFVGQVMKNSGGKADPEGVNRILQEELDLRR